jgi:hypothetical protein
MFEFINGYEGHFAVFCGLVLFAMGWLKGKEIGVRHGIEATLSLMHTARVIRIVEDEHGEQHIMTTDNKPIMLDNAPTK